MNHFLVIFLALLVGSAVAHSEAHDNLGDKARIIQLKNNTFHESVSVIRKMHPEFLYHKRDKTLRQGVRTEESSLKYCIDCHTNSDEKTKAFIPVDDSGQFCAGCHAEVSVSLDCFSCHRTTPEKGGSL